MARVVVSIRTVLFQGEVETWGSSWLWREDYGNAVGEAVAALRFFDGDLAFGEGFAIGTHGGFDVVARIFSISDSDNWTIIGSSGLVRGREERRGELPLAVASYYSFVGNVYQMSIFDW